MPFIRNVVKPVCLQKEVPPRNGDEESALQDFTNLALVNIIRQIASLHSKVDIIFGHLMVESQDLHRRLQEAKSKLAKLDEKISEIDSNNEAVGKAFGKDKKAVYKRIADRSNFFQSERQLDSGLFMEASAPHELKSLHEQADPMPRLQDLDKFRTDGKYCAKFYTNPHMFFQAWQESLQQMIAEQHAKSLMKSKRTVRQTNLRRVKKAKASRIIEAQKLKMGVELATPASPSTEQDEEEYFSDEEWSDMSDDDVLLSPSSARLYNNGLGLQNGSLSVMSNHHRLSSFGEYNIEDLELTKLKIETHSPPVSIVGGDFSNYDGEFAEYSFQFSLDSMSLPKWEENGDKT